MPSLYQCYSLVCGSSRQATSVCSLSPSDFITVHVRRLSAILFSRVRVSVASLQESNGQSANCRCRNNPTKPVMSLQSSVDATADSTDADEQCSQHATDALNKYKDVDARLLTTSSFCFDLSLFEDPIYSIRANGMQTLNTCNRQKRGIGMVVLNNHFRSSAPFNVCGSLPTHA